MYVTMLNVKSTENALLVLKAELSRGVGCTPHMKVVGMLVVLLRGVNFGFWSHLGCSGQNTIIFSREGLV